MPQLPTPHTPHPPPGGTVTGTIGQIAANRFVLIDDGALEPRQIIRQNGATFGRGERHHDDD